MPTLLLDASAWLAAYDTGNSHHGAAQELIVHPSVQHAALDLTMYEIANTTARMWNNPTLGADLTRLIMRSCGPRLIRVNADLAHDAITTAAKLNLTAYDAAYVAASRELGCALVSTDHKDLVDPGQATTPTAALQEL